MDAYDEQCKHPYCRLQFSETNLGTLFLLLSATVHVINATAEPVLLPRSVMQGKRFKILQSDVL
jgi:hypothetical protein